MGNGQLGDMGQLDDMAHVVELRTTYRSGRPDAPRGYWGRCSCGESSPVFSAAGMVWGWETGHKDSQRGDSEAT